MEVTPKAAKIKTLYSSPCGSEQSSPCDYKEEKHHPKLSASLRERLKRSRRSFISPLSVAKRLCVDDEEEDGQQVSAGTDNNVPVIAQGVDVNRNETGSLSERFAGSVPEPIPSEDTLQRLRREVKKKTETLRRLRMVKMYRSKNDLAQLQTLIDKWRSCAQAALYELQSNVPINGQKANLSELIDLFSLDDAILHFDRTEDDFAS